MTEEWRTILDYRDLYEVSSQGRVRSLDRMVVTSRGHFRRIAGRVLNRTLLANGYLAVGLSKFGVQPKRYVHELVAEAFLGARPDGLVVRHLDGDCLNNAVDNLKWGTYSENTQDCLRHGTHGQLSKSHCPLGHFLDQPNLAPSSAKLGYRKCLSCSRARNRIRYYGFPKSDMQAISDSYYQQIVSAA